MAEAEQEIFTAPWYPWYADDILLSERVELMNLAEEGAYRRALDRAWKKGSLPANPKDFARAIGKGCSKKIAEVVLQMFTPMPNDPTRVIQERLEVVRDEQRLKYLDRSAKAKIAADKRWKNHAPSNAQAMLKECQSESESDTEEKKEEKRGKSSPPSEPSRHDFGPPQNVPPKESLFGHPVIEALRLVTKRTPKPEARQHLVNKVRGEIDLPKLQIAFGEWSARGYKDTNFDGILDWYLGKRDGKNRSAFTKRTDADVIAESADFYEQYPS